MKTFLSIMLCFDEYVVEKVFLFVFAVHFCEHFLENDFSPKKFKKKISVRKRKRKHICRLLILPIRLFVWPAVLSRPQI